jgi:hypothetical protein
MSGDGNEGRECIREKSSELVLFQITKNLDFIIKLCVYNVS